MKSKAKVQIKSPSANILLKVSFYAVLGGFFALGKLSPSAHPFALSLVAALSGATTALSAAIGAAVGSVFIRSGGIHAILVFLITGARVILGRYLKYEPRLTEEKSDLDESTRSSRVAKYLLTLVSEGVKHGFFEPVFIRMTLAVSASLLYGAARCAFGGYTTQDLLGAVTASLLTPLLVFLYSHAGDANSSENSALLSEAGKCAVAVSLVISLSSMSSFFDITVPAAFIITILVTRQSGILVGMIYGIICGVVLTPVLAPMYALSALVAGMLWRYSPAVAVTGSCTVCCIWSIYAVGLNAMNGTVPAIIITSAVLAPIVSSRFLPSPKDEAVLSASPARDDTPSVMLKRENSKKMHSLSKSMSELSAVLYRLSDKLTSPETEELCELCEASFEESCRSCGMRSACFGREAEQTAALQARMTLALRDDGRVSAALIPQAMAKRCYSMGQIIDRMNAGCARMISESKLYDRTSVVAADYEVMSEMLRDSAEYDFDEFELDRELTNRVRSYVRGAVKADNIGVFGTRVKKVIARGVDVTSGTPGAREICDLFSRACGFALTEPEFELNNTQVIMKLQSLPRLQVRCGRASVAMSELGRAAVATSHASSQATKVFTHDEVRGLGKTSSEVCGDVISAFLTDDGRFFMLISDGMGSGKDAALTSGICAVFIEKLLKAGASMDTSLKMLNSMMRVRGNEVAATVDLMELDLMNGKTRFVKSGAAPSFVLRGGRLFRLQSKTVPIGIVRALDAEMIKFETEPGDIIVMLSDGVVRSFEDCPWLYDLLCDEKEWSSDPEKMARKIIKYAVKNGAEDDITAGIVMVDDIGE